MNYVTVIPADPRNGWLVASRRGSLIEHKRLEAPRGNREAARAEAQAILPDAHVYVQGDDYKPWQDTPARPAPVRPARAAESSPANIVRIDLALMRNPIGGQS